MENLDVDEDGFGLRSELTSEQRLADMKLVIDPGFVNHRLVETSLPGGTTTVLNAAIAQIPDMPEGLRRGRIDHVYSAVTLEFCKAMNVPSLGDVLAAGKGYWFSSVVELQPCPDVYDERRVTTKIVIPGVESPDVVIQYSTAHVHADTTRMNLANGGPMAVVAKFDRRLDDGALRFQPLVMGAPWLRPEGGPDPLAGAEWYSFNYFEIFVEDFEEFKKVRDVPRPSDVSVMEKVSETAFKTCLAEILGEETRKDWGGETSDHYSSSVTLKGQRATAAFLLKGPARFGPMGLNHLGKNNDQIYRLSQEPAQVLVVQHCHEITSPVRATLRAFAVRPEMSRRYCLIDGRDSLRLLEAYGKLQRALDLSA